VVHRRQLRAADEGLAARPHRYAPTLFAHQVVCRTRKWEQKPARVPHSWRKPRSLNLTEASILIGHSMGGLLAQQLAARIQPFALVLLTPSWPAGIWGLR
jgi:pimeloyl-ACP methyl ester carboxylesterase